MNVVNIVPMKFPPPPLRSRTEPHLAVLAHEAIDALHPHHGGIYVDATLGAGGHTQLLLQTNGTSVIGIDRDASALALARTRLAPFSSRISFVQGAFSEIEHHLDALGIHVVDGLIADIGISSMQLDDASRGMSFKADGPLDMRMDQTRGPTALDLIDELDDDELANIIFRYGEERRSRRVARCIKQSRSQGELHTTFDLRRAVVRAVGPARIGGIDPATRTFQALRIAVNNELDELKALLSTAARIVAPGGVLVVITFHSLEDRIVKHTLRDRSLWIPLARKPITATDEELLHNPRARSAKLRAARRAATEEVLA